MLSKPSNRHEERDLKDLNDFIKDQGMEYAESEVLDESENEVSSFSEEDEDDVEAEARKGLMAIPPSKAVTK
jgi:hypothetical protein